MICAIPNKDPIVNCRFLIPPQVHQPAVLSDPAQLAQLDRHWQALSLEEWLDAFIPIFVGNVGALPRIMLSKSIVILKVLYYGVWGYKISKFIFISFPQGCIMK